MGNYGSCVEKEIVLVTERERLSYVVRPQGESQAPGERRSGAADAGGGRGRSLASAHPPFWSLGTFTAVSLHRGPVGLAGGAPSSAAERKPH